MEITFSSDEMSDRLTPRERSLHMARIGDRDTKPELQIRHGLHALGFRYRLHVPKLPGRPDIVFPKFGAVILIHGCFWHHHDCGLCRIPNTRSDFWRAKLTANRARDQRVLASLGAKGWRTLVVWECGLRGPTRLGRDAVVARCAEWLRSSEPVGEIMGEAECR